MNVDLLSQIKQELLSDPLSLEKLAKAYLLLSEQCQQQDDIKLQAVGTQLAALNAVLVQKIDALMGHVLQS